MQEAEEIIRRWSSMTNEEFSRDDNPDRILFLNDLDLEQLPDIPNNVTILHCYNNRLTSLPNLPNLIYLSCFVNGLTSLPNLPNLIYLDCSNNRLTSLPNLPNLIRLDCSFNLLTSLPHLPNVVNLKCFNNRISTIIGSIDRTKLKNLTYTESRISNAEKEELRRIDGLTLTNRRNIEDILEDRGSPILDAPADFDHEDDLPIGANFDREEEIENNERIIRDMERSKRELEEKEEERKYKALVDTDEKNLGSLCDNKIDILTQELLDTSKGVVTLISINKDRYSYQCFKLDDLRTTFRNAPDIHEWNMEKHRAYPDRPVYKLPHRGDFIDFNSVERLKRFNTFVIQPRDKKVYLGSMFGISRMHGHEQDRHDINMLIPIHRSTFLNKEKISISDLFNFEPRPEDYNPYYIKYKDADWKTIHREVEE